MTEPNQTPSKSGWQPTVSTAAGALIGSAVGELIVDIAADLMSRPLKESAIKSIYTLCIAIAGYCFPDGGRK